LFGNANPTIFYLLGNANNFIHLDFQAASNVRLRYNASGAGVQTGNYNPATLNAGTKYMLDVLFHPGGMMLFIDGILRINIIAACVFNVPLATMYWGSTNLGTQQYDVIASGS
jgi:hypothetical protein